MGRKIRFLNSLMILRQKNCNQLYLVYSYSHRQIRSTMVSSDDDFIHITKLGKNL